MSDDRGELILDYAKQIKAELEQPDTLLFHSPRLKELIDLMCDQLLMLAIANKPVE